MFFGLPRSVSCFHKEIPDPYDISFSLSVSVKCYILCHTLQEDNENVCATAAAASPGQRF